MTVAGTTDSQAQVRPSVDGSRLGYIDGIRGAASLMVVFEHALERWVPGYLEWSMQWINMGRVGIVAFFLVSGYVVGVTLSTQTVRTFAVRRFWRLYPVYWLATILYVATSLATGGFDSDVSLFVVIVNITMIQGFVSVHSILGVAWTLGLEVVYYLQSIMAKALGRLQLSIWLGMGWLVVFGAMAFANAVLGTSMTAVGPLMLFTASAGYAVYLWDKNRTRHWLVYLIVALLSIPFLSIPLQSAFEWTAFSFALSYLAGLGLFALFYSLRARHIPAFILWLGAISYILYLVHDTINIVLATTSLPAVVLIPAAVVTSLLVAGLLHRLVEKPLIGIGRRLTQGQRNPESS